MAQGFLTLSAVLIPIAYYGYTNAVLAVKCGLSTRESGKGRRERADDRKGDAGGAWIS